MPAIFHTVAVLLIALIVSAATQADAPPLDLVNNDRVVFLGDGLIEQEQYHGWVEVMLTSSFADHDITFRNIGWSGDTPAGASRFGLSLLQAGNEPADEGWKQLQKQLQQTKPSVVLLGYGMSSSLELGESKVEQFVEEYQRLLAFLREVNADMRFVFLSPLGRVELPNQSTSTGGTQHVQALRVYRDAIAKLAESHDSLFLDISTVGKTPAHRRDSIHLNDKGYLALAQFIAQKTNLSWKPEESNAALRRAILKKNEWFFHRSRPANMAYVFGFRKREQGQNAVEIPQFDVLIAEEEKRIATLRNGGAEAVPTKPPRTKSAYAKFTPQPLPEFTTAEGWEVTLWAENPMLNKPIQMNFDPAGRLWVASSEAYPMIEVGQTANDRIIVLEDSNHDGKADKSTVFADGLLIPTGVIPNHDGVYVAQSTDLLHLQDTDGDGKADKKTRVLSGFGTEDTHHNLHTLRWGPDGRLYMNQSVYTRTDSETPRGVTRLKAGGGFRFHPSSMRMQVFFAGLWNSWGHQFDAFGRSFMTDGAGFAGVAYVFPGAQFRPLPRGQRQLGLISPGNYPKFCSAEIVSGDSFPDDWQDTLVTCDFRANRVTRFSLVEDGAGFETVQQDDLLRTSTATFRPIDVKQGPDGALYIADWSNPIINHGEVDFRDPRRDRWHGRIWRVARKDRPRKKPVDLTQRSTGELLDHLNSNDRYVRDRARRVLISRPAKTMEALDDWVAKQTASYAKIQTLWLYQALDQSNSGLLEKLLRDPSANIRAAATRVLSDWSDPNTDCRNPLAPDVARTYFALLLKDSHPRVRLEAIVGLTAWNDAAAAQLALFALSSPTDRFIEFALAEIVGDTAEQLLPRLKQTNASDKQLEFVLLSVKPDQASSFLGDYLANNELPKDGSGPWIRLIGNAGGIVELNRLFDDVVDRKLDSTGTVQALDALRDAQRLRKKKPNKSRDRLKPMLTHADLGVQQSAIRLAGAWKVRSLLPAIAAVARDEKQTAAMRLVAVEAIGDLGGKAALKQLAMESADDAVMSTNALKNLARLDASSAIEVFLSLPIQGDEAESVERWRAVLAGKGSDKALSQRIVDLPWSQAHIQAGLRVAREGGRKAPELVQALTAKLGAATTIAWTQEQTKQLAFDAQKSGDPHRGELIYRRAELACVTCHALADDGGKVGPDLSSIGASAPIDYIADSLYRPNAKIKENYHSAIVVTDDGRQLSGIVSADSTDQELVLRDATNKLVRIPRGEIEEQTAGPSLMPGGLVERLEKSEQLDLIHFLSVLGKPGEFDASKRNVARRFELLPGTHRVEQEGLASILAGDTKGWKPVAARISGRLDKSVIQAVSQPPRNMSLVTVYLRTMVEVVEDGKVKFAVEGDPALWVDGQEAELVDGVATVDLKAGQHEVVLQLDARQLPASTRLTSENATFR